MSVYHSVLLHFFSALSSFRNLVSLSSKSPAVSCIKIFAVFIFHWTVGEFFFCPIGTMCWFYIVLFFDQTFYFRQHYLAILVSNSFKYNIFFLVQSLSKVLPIYLSPFICSSRISVFSVNVFFLFAILLSVFKIQNNNIEQNIY